jgi:hypothetical protein
MTAYTPEAWDSFFLGLTGASAALAGLLFVGVSINLSTITTSTGLVRRALEAFVLLAEVLMLSVLLLVPDASRTALGWGLLAIGVAAWAAVSLMHVQVAPTQRGAAAADAPRFSFLIRVVLAQAATLPFIIGAVGLIAEAGGGLYWFAPGALFSLAAVLTDAWVLLIEIQR